MCVDDGSRVVTGDGVEATQLDKNPKIIDVHAIILLIYNVHVVTRNKYLAAHQVRLVSFPDCSSTHHFSLSRYWLMRHH